MAQVLISDLTAGAALTGSEVFESEQSGNSRKHTALQLADLICPRGSVLDYAGIVEPELFKFVPLETTTISRTTYNDFWTELGEIDWFAPDATAASDATTAGTFHLPTLQDVYSRSGFHAAATFNNADNSVTLAQNGTAIDSNWKDGTAIRFIGGTMPTGITEYTTYYLGWNTDKWLIYDTAANGEINDGSTGLVAFTTDGSGVTGTQFGITLEDQMQLIEGSASSTPTISFILGDGIVSGALKKGTLRDNNVVGTAGTADAHDIAFDSSLSPNARTSATTSGETRGRLGYLRKIIRVL